jgi:uncharacterized protein (TIGR02271 family)
MPPLGSVVVRDKDGVRGTIVSAPPRTPSNVSQVVVQWENGQHIVVPADMLLPQPDGTYYLPRNLSELTPAHSGEPTDVRETLAMPVLVEEPDIQKRVVETGKVSITKQVHEREVLVDEPLCREEVEVTRVPMQRVVDAPIPVRHENGTMIISVLEEVLVVEKRLMLKEEIHIRKHHVETHQPQQVTLRSEEVCVERLNTLEASEASDDT